MKTNWLFFVVPLLCFSQIIHAQEDSSHPSSITWLHHKQEVMTPFDLKEEAWIFSIPQGYRLVSRKNQNILWIDMTPQGHMQTTLPEIWKGPYTLEKKTELGIENIYSAAENALIQEDGSFVLSGIFRPQNHPENPMGSGFIAFQLPSTSKEKQPIKFHVRPIMKKGAVSVHINQLALQTVIETEELKPIRKTSTTLPDTSKTISSQRLLVAGFYDIPLQELGKPSRLGEKAAQICGGKQSSSAYRMFVQRYQLPQGSLDMNFASEGTVGFFSCDPLFPIGLASQADGTILLLYQTISVNKKKVLVAQFSQTGQWLGSKPLAPSTIQNTEEISRRFFVTNDGIYEAFLKESPTLGALQLFLIRYQADGIVDKTFGQKEISLGSIELSKEIPFSLSKKTDTKHFFFQIMMEPNSKHIFVAVESMIPSLSLPSSKNNTSIETLFGNQMGGTFAGAAPLLQITPLPEHQQDTSPQRGLLLFCRTQQGLPCDLPFSIIELSPSPDEFVQALRIEKETVLMLQSQKLMSFPFPQTIENKLPTSEK